MVKALRRLVNPPTVKEIHDSFETATQSAVEEAKKIIGSFDIEQKQKRVDTLRLLGFTSMKEVKEHSKLQSEYDKAKGMLVKAEKWEKLYPQYKFITVEHTIALCKKYGLLCAPVGKYKGDIPDKNLQEIAKFNVKSEHRFYERVVRFSDYVEFDVTSPSKFVPETAALSSMYSLYGSNYVKVPMFICAPRADLNIDKGSKIHGKVFLSRKIEDPIVLHFVKEGFLIVSKWGPEAKDPSLVNQKMN